MTEKIILELDKNKAASLLDFIEVDFLNGIIESRADNLEYVCNICEIYKQLKKAEVEKP